MGQLAASLYGGSISAEASADVRRATPSFTVDYQLAGVQAEPLLKDMLEGDAPVTGQADYSASITTSGNTVNQLKAALNGRFSSDFTNGAVNGINVGYQLRRARELIKGRALPDPATVTTDFSAMHLGAIITNGVLTSDDLDVRSPGMRISGDGSVDLVKEYVDYTIHTKVAETSEGQGGKDLDDLKGLALSIPIRGSFNELSTDFAGAIQDAIKDDLKNKARDKAEALARKEAAKLKAEALAKAEKAKARAKKELAAKEAEAKARLAPAPPAIIIAKSCPA